MRADIELALNTKLILNRELFEQFECKHLSSEDRLVVFPCSLPTRTTMVLKSVYGKEVKTKEVLNVVNPKSQCSYGVWGDILGVTDLDVVVVVSGKAVIGKIYYTNNYRTDNYELQMSLNGTMYTILTIGDQDASFQSPHLMEI
tara:strand:- start:46 stop:477 length:432 start_codon:yes stop_codon:yes gene_type:complete